MGTGNRGFTLIELLVVITLIASLMGLGLLMLGQAGEKRDVVKTTNRLTGLQSALVKLAGKGPGTYDMDIPTDPMKLRGPKREKVGPDIGSPNATNLGIESVYVAMYLKGVNVPTSGIDEEAFGNTDEDQMSKNPTRTPSNDLREFVDAWGNPFAYFYGPEMKSWEKYSKYVMGNGTTVKVKPWMNEATGDFINAESFQLFSAGPDMTFNTEDDIKSW